MHLGGGGTMSSEGACRQTITILPINPHPKPSPQPVTEAPEWRIVTATRKMTRPQKHEPKFTAAPKRTVGKSKKKADAVSKPRPPTHTSKPGGHHPKLHLSTRGNLIPPRPPPPPACVEFTSSLPTGAGRPRAVRQTVILFVAEYSSTPYENGTV